MTTRTVSYPFKFGKSVMKSMVIDFHGWSEPDLIQHSIWCMSDHFTPLANVAVLDVLFDFFPHSWGVVLSADQFGSFYRPAMSCKWVVVDFVYKTRPESFVVWYPDLFLIS